MISNKSVSSVMSVSVSATHNGIVVLAAGRVLLFVVVVVAEGKFASPVLGCCSLCWTRAPILLQEKIQKMFLKALFFLFFFFLS